MCGTAKNVDGALEEKEMDKLVENYVFKIKVVEFRTDKGGYPLYFVTMMLWDVQKQERRQRMFVWTLLDMNVELTYKILKFTHKA